MSTTGFNLTRSGAGVRIADFIAFVSDRATEQVLKSFVLEQAMPHVHVVIGGIDDAIVGPTRSVEDLHIVADVHCGAEGGAPAGDGVSTDGIACPRVAVERGEKAPAGIALSASDMDELSALLTHGVPVTIQ